MISKLYDFRRYFLTSKGKLMGLLGLVVLTGLAEGLGVSLFYPLLEYIEQGPAFLTEGHSRVLFAWLSGVGLSPSVGLFIFLIFLVIVTTLALKYSVFVLSAIVTNTATHTLRAEAFRKILSSHLFHFYSSSSATLAQTLENETEHVGQSFNFAVQIAAALLSIGIYVSFLMFVSPKLTFLVCAIAAMRYGVSTLFIKRARRLGEEHGELRTRLKSSLIAVHQGIDVVKSFGAEGREVAKFLNLSRRIKTNAVAVARTAAGNTFCEGILGDGLLCVIIYLAVSRLSVSGVTLLAFLFVITRIIPKVTLLNDGRIRIAEYLSRVLTLPEVLLGEGLPTLKWGDTAKKDFRDRIVFENVSMRYPGAEADSLHGVNLVIMKNETVAIVGESGAGKSTLARLLLRLFDPVSGSVTVDGKALPSLKREDWTRLVSVVSQDTFIFDDTLENNVKYGVPDCSDARFQDALEQSRCVEFVAALPEKEKTHLGERGVRLSGGQRQRIAIARAFLRDAPILILDEATSAMDAVTEKLIQDAIHELSKERTVVVIAHRFTTIRNASRIVVLDKGRVAEAGSHEELLKAGNVYTRFHELQSR